MAWLALGIGIGIMIIGGHWYVGKATEFFFALYKKIGWKSKYDEYIDRDRAAAKNLDQ